MCAQKCVEKIAFVVRRKMTNFKNNLQVWRRYRNRVGGIGDMRNETAVLSERRRESLARARRALVQHIAQNGLVTLNKGSFRVAAGRGAHSVSRERSSSAIACLVLASAAGATDKLLKPVDSSARMNLGSPPASPQRLTLRPMAEPCAATRVIRRKTAGWLASLRAATASLSRAAAMTYCVRSLDPIEKKAASSKSMAMAAAGTSTITPSGGIRHVAFLACTASNSSSRIRRA